VPGRDVCRDYLSRSRGSHLLGAPTTLMYRAHVICGQERFFREPKLHADAEACLRVLAHHDYAFVHQILTFTRLREGSLTSDADRLHVYIPNILEFLIKFGPTCFNGQELEQRIEDQLAHYYNYLGRQFFHQRDRKFWAFHRGRLAELGCPLKNVRLMFNVILYGIQAAVWRAQRMA
jgi:hypothetical protein